MTTKKTLLVLGVLVVLALAVSAWNKNEPSEFSEGDYLPPVEANTVSVPDTTSKTIKPISSAPKSPTATAPTSVTPVRVLENGQYITIVNLTNKGFVPQAVSINRGESVRYVNKSGSAMRITSTTEYLGLDQQQSVGMNGIYELSFPRVGTWTFNNNRNLNIIGVVNVK
ncbi:MAG: hypothetical protein Q7S86_04085 [bacterium]|nr:hypothetical protein [bacterium]